MDYEAIFKGIIRGIVAFLKARLVTMIWVAGIAAFLFTAVSLYRYTNAQIIAKLSSTDRAVASGEVLQLCSTGDLFDKLISTEDPDTPSTSEQNIASATIRENAAICLNDLIATKRIPANEAMDNLFMLYKDSDQKIKDTSTAGLAALAKESDANLQTLVKKLGDGDPDVRTASGLALGFVKGARAASLAAPLLTNTDASTAAQTALQNIGRDSVPFLIPMLNGANDDLRAQIVTTLGNIGDESAVPAIVEQCNVTPIVPNTHRLAVLGLANAIIKSYPSNPTMTFGKTIAQPLPRVIAAKDAAAATLAEPIFLRVLADTSEDNFARARSALALGRIGGTNASVHLVSALSDFDNRVVSAATSGLREVGPSAVPVVKNSLLSKNVQVRIASAEALGGISDSTSLSAIQIALHDKDPDVRQSASDALGIGGNPASISLLIPLLNDPNGIVSSSATASIAEFGKSSVPALIALLGSSNSVAALHASSALKSIGDDAQPAVLAALNSGSDTQRAWAALTLGDLQDYAAEPQLELVAAGQLPHAKFAAQQALQELGKV